jgi:hypothetical protein
MKLRLIVLVVVVFGSVGMWCQTASSVPKTLADAMAAPAPNSQAVVKSSNNNGGDDLLSEPTKPVLLRIQAQPKKQFWFRIDCPSTIDPCRTVGVWATDQAAAQKEAQRNFANCTVTPIDPSQQAHACHN